MAHHRFPFAKAAKLNSPERQRQQPAAPLVELIASFAPQDVLEVGAGTGYFLLPLAEALPTTEVWGVDVEPKFLEIITQRAASMELSGHLHLQETHPDHLDLGDDAFDVVLLASLYHELRHRRLYLDELRRVLRPGGHLIICDWAPPLAGLPAAGPPPDHRVPPEVAKAELVDAGFTALSTHDLYDGFFTFVAVG